VILAFSASLMSLFFFVTKGAKAQLKIRKQLGGGKLHPYNHQQELGLTPEGNDHKQWCLWQINNLC
jgi:hypothetical protein